MLHGGRHVSKQLVVQNRCDAILRAFLMVGVNFFVVLLEFFFVHDGCSVG
jgi:hypothetical protein